MIDALMQDLAAGAVPPAGAVAGLARLARDPHLASPSEIAAAMAALERRIGPAPTAHAFFAALMQERSLTASGTRGAIAASSPAAVSAGAHLLAEGGNAIDAACAAALALTVTDPANAGVGGRTHIVIGWPDGRTRVIDGATQAPSRSQVPGKAGRLTSVPVPGMLAGIARAAAAGASRPWPELVAPAISLAEDGFPVPRGLAAVWAAQRDRLARHPETARTFLKADRAPYGAGELFRQPALASLLERVAGEGAAALYRGAVAEDIARQMEAEGGWVRADDLAAYAAREGEAVTGRYGPYTITAPGVQAWGHTLIEMLQIADRFDFSSPTWSGRDAEALALIALVALADRPEWPGTLAPRAGGLPHALLADPDFAARRAADVQRLLGARNPELAPLIDATRRGPRGDTTHLSVIDAQGIAVALTCSMGPFFGSGITAAGHGFLFAHSYRMISSPAPGARDATEMCPAIFSRDGRPVLATGGAGSERIPVAVALTAVNLLRRGLPPAEAVAAPRFAWTDGRLRTHCDLGADAIAHLQARGLPVQVIGRDYLTHAGIVHLVRSDAAEGCEGAADPAYDGIAVSG